jgi:hypothetical protein
MPTRIAMTQGGGGEGGGEGEGEGEEEEEEELLTILSKKVENSYPFPVAEGI